jgi:preprotein translocase subunit Sec61beta
MSVKRNFIPPSMAGITTFYSDLKTKYYLTPKQFFYLVLGVALVIILLHYIYPTS